MSCLWVGACVLETLRKKGLQVHPLLIALVAVKDF